MKDKWISRWASLVDLVASWSSDPSTKVGAVILPENGDVPIFGCNGFARGLVDREERYKNRDDKYKFIIHAECNAIYNAGRNMVNIKNGTIFVSSFPCHNCANSIVQAGIKEVFVTKKTDQDMMERWGESFYYSSVILKECGVIVNV